MRSTKAGPSGPATLPGVICLPLALARSTKAGPSGPATRGGKCAVRAGTPRSTKAGPSGPATPQLIDRFGEVIAHAQRRPALPGRQPVLRAAAATATGPAAQRRPALPGRQPLLAVVAAAGRSLRSTKAGPSGPATRVDLHGDAARRDERSTKAGPSGPATLCVATFDHLVTVFAQRRPALPGRQPPEPTRQQEHARNAQRRPALPGRQPRRLPATSRRAGARSTKAGPSGPATPLFGTPSQGDVKTLNEGRPFRAGNPGGSDASFRRFACSPLNEGRPFRAGNPPRTGRTQGSVYGAQRRPALPGRQPWA